MRGLRGFVDLGRVWGFSVAVSVAFSLMPHSLFSLPTQFSMLHPSPELGGSGSEEEGSLWG